MISSSCVHTCPALVGWPRSFFLLILLVFCECRPLLQEKHPRLTHLNSFCIETLPTETRARYKLRTFL